MRGTITVARQRAAIVALCALLGAGVAVGAWWAFARGKGPAEPATRASAAATGADDAAGVAAMLAGLPRDPQAAVPRANRSLIPNARAAIPPDATVTPHPESWQPDGVGGGIMTVTVTQPGAAPRTFAVIVVHESDGWKVAATMAVTDSPAPSRS